MALTTGILVAKYLKKGKMYETLVLVDDAAVSAAWTQLSSTTPGYLADGTRLKSARLFNPAVYNAVGELIPNQSTLVFGAGGQWDSPASQVDFTSVGALGDPGSCAMNILRLASNVADAETFTLTGAGEFNGITEVYEFTDDGALTTPTNIPINIAGGLTPTIVSPLIVSAINSSSKLDIFAEAISVNEIAIRKNEAGVDITGCTEAMAGANNVWAAAAFYGGIAPTATLRRQVQNRVPNATEVTLGNMHFEFDFPPNNPIVQLITTSTGAVVVFGGNKTTNGNRLTLHNTGTSDFAATQTVTVLVTD